MTRAEYIRRHFRLEQRPGGQWAAVWASPTQPAIEIVGRDRLAAAREARRRWGHVNHQDEAEALAEVFS